MSIDYYKFQDKNGIDINTYSYIYANLWLHEFRKSKLPTPKVKFWYREPGLWLPLSCAITVVSSTHAASSDGNAVTTTGINTSGADFLVLSLDAFNGILPIGNPSDSNGNTWNNLTTHVCNGGNVSGFISYAINPTVGSGHTFTFGANLTFPAICVAAFSGLDTATPFDGQENGNDNINAITGSTGSITPVNNDALVIAVWNALDGATQASPISPVEYDPPLEFQLSDGTITHVGASLAYRVFVGAPSAQNPVFSWTATCRHWAAIASFKPAGTSITVKQLPALGVGN